MLEELQKEFSRIDLNLAVIPANMVSLTNKVFSIIK